MAGLSASDADEREISGMCMHRQIGGTTFCRNIKLMPVCRCDRDDGFGRSFDAIETAVFSKTKDSRDVSHKEVKHENSINNRRK